jgi:hypothetical protein
MKETISLNYEGQIFNPCRYCSNIMMQDCFDNCIYIGDFNRFILRPGTGVKDLPPFPLDEVFDENNARIRLVIVSIYLTAITDYLQHQDEYEFREKAQGSKTTVPDLKISKM